MTPFSIMRGLTRTQLSRCSRMTVASPVQVFQKKFVLWHLMFTVRVVSTVF